MQHQWKKDERGNPDEFAWEVEDWETAGGHGGPECTVCGWAPCIHCVQFMGKDVYNSSDFPCVGVSPMPYERKEG